MRCTKPIRLMHLNHVEYPDGLLVPCGSVLLAALHVDKNGLCGLYMSWPDIKTRFF